MTPVQVLREARALLVRDGWCQYDGKSSGGPRCAMGAVRDSAPNDDRWPIYDLLRDAIGKSSEPRWNSCLARWNDAPGRTVDEVLAAFDVAIAAAEERGGG